MSTRSRPHICGESLPLTVAEVEDLANVVVAVDSGGTRIACERVDM